MEILIAKRTPVRGNFTKCYKSLIDAINDIKSSRKDIEIKLSSFERIVSDLTALDNEIYELLVVEKSEKLEEEYNKMEDYRVKIDIARVEAKICIEKFSVIPETAMSITAEKTKLKLPKIELIKFSGKIKDWLSFWSQFSRIHDDEFMNDEDKFQYLIQCMVSGGRAKEIVDSYPPSAENYSKVIDSLKQRFGRDELLVEFYVRELLTLVVKNAMNTKTKMSVMQLYDKLESYLRSLESLGVTKEKYAAMLFPLVESSIPEDLLRIWLRNPVLLVGQTESDGKSEVDSYGGKLSQLLSFLRAEVEGEERISLAKTGFKQNDSSLRKKDRDYEIYTPVATANDLFSSHSKPISHNEKDSCIFCEKHHESRDCFVAQKMTLSQKNEKIKKKKGCFSCLKIGHRSKACKTYVCCLLCSKKHWGVMCPELHTNQKKNQVDENKEDERTNVSLASTNLVNEVFLQTLLINVVTKKTQKTVRALIDTGSQRSYILRETAEDIGCQQCGTESLVHALFGGIKTKKEIHRRYEVKVKSLESTYTSRLILLEQSKICEAVPSLQPGPWIEELKQRNIYASDLGKGHVKVEVLIGADVAGALFTGRIQKLENGLTAVETLLGWTVMGKVEGNSLEENSFSMSSTITSMLSHTSSIENLWKLEAIGITDPCEKQTKEELDKAAYDSFNQTVHRDEDGRYKVKLLWSRNVEDLCSNRDVARKRLSSNTSRLVKEDMFDSYDAVFQEWQDEGIIEKSDEGPGHYLPHRGVFKPNSTTKVRPVFDASCKSKGGLSLNDCLMKGPNLLDLIPSKLLKFREKNFGVISDIRKAFLQISVSEEDRQFLKFLWWKDKEMKTVQVFQHKRVVFGLNCSPFLLTAVINYHLDQYLSTSLRETAQQLKSSFYVDNCVSSVDTEDELKTFITNSTSIMADACFDLRGWETTNDVSSKERNEPSQVLGLMWDRHEDVLFCDTRSIKPLEGAVTRRTILSIAHKVFDPIGFTCPVTVYPKKLLQESWRTRVSWDAEVADDVKEKFLKWMTELKDLVFVRIPRQAFLSGSDGQSIHVFCDASGVSYAAVVFLRTEKDGKCEVQLLMAKSRIAPLKPTSIPRLELLSCCVGVRLLDFVKHSLNLRNIEVFCWTDSSTALHWITKDEPWGVFVLNRVKEIRKMSDVRSWRHIPGQHNPADLPSRGCSVEKLICSRWWEGPPWLRREPDSWPKSEAMLKENAAQEEIPTVTLHSKKDSLQKIEYLSYFSSYTKIIRMFGWILRFLNNVRKKTTKVTDENLSTDELKNAEIKLLTVVQGEELTPEYIQTLKLNIFKDDDGLLKVKTKLTEREDTEDFKLPIVLPGRHPLVHLLIREKHLGKLHAGLHIMMSCLRENFWIISGRKTIRKVINQCLRCKWHSSKGVETVPIGLPVDRVKDAAVFEVVGIDLAGPLILKGGEKGWIVLFTCAVYRALHLEFVLSLSTKSFLLSLRRFIARRGRPAIIYSDNGTNFTGAENLFRSLDWSTITRDSAICKIEWKFIPPSAAWWGGFWERMVQMVKKILRRVLGKAALHSEEVISLLCDCEAVINSRPITHLSEDPSDLVALTPAMFLQDNRTVGVPDLDRLDETDIKGRWKYQQSLREHLRKRFRVEYLGSLVQQKEKSKYGTVNVGDVVLIESDVKKRVLWPLAKIIEVYPGKDGNVRVVKLKTSHGEVIRPVKKIYPLEVQEKPPKQPEQCPSIKKTPFGESDQIPVSVKKPERQVMESESTVKGVTRCGRTVKIPARLLD